MNHTSCADFLEFFGYFHGYVVSEDGDSLNLVYSLLDASPISKIHAFKDLGNDLFRQNQFVEASACYDKACRLLSDVLKDVSDLDLNSLSSLAISLSLNLAASAIKLRAFDGALILCSMVLNFYPHHAKTLFRKAVALRSLNKLSEARCTFEEAVSVEPQNNDILRELDEVRKLHVFNLNGKRVVDDSFKAN
ncbi:uncharacterized protein LOC141640498 [Silene latifolia]|uniref:uncharacterized protein LOC141640498 n=1 Tax=Silene latifolia TaxID=37657 RepID=UPI003D77EFFA